jgi:hypothetical protein
MRTALSNNSGELVIPAIVTGSFKQPKFAPDVQAFVQLQKQRLLPSLENPKGALGSILGAITSKTDKTAEPATEQKAAETKPAEAKPAETIKGILGGFLGGRTKDASK